MNPTPHALARAFATELHAELGTDTLAEINRLNDAETDTGICHTHDFCDANQVMLDAWEKLMGAECSCDSTNDAENAVWNEAWSIASKANFNRSVLLALDLYHAGHRITKAGKLVDPTKRLVPEEIKAATKPELPPGIIAQAVHMVHVWSLNPKRLGIPDKI
jgi:hypothetical protein